MGYTTDFDGSFQLDKPLEGWQRAFLEQFSRTRRMQRDPAKITELGLDDPIREAAKLPLGKEGGYFVGGTGDFGQGKDESILNYNRPPSGQPGLWCQWVPNDDGTEIEWDGGEKFYDYVEWLKYIIQHFLEPWGYKLNGEVAWSGEEMGDAGVIYVKDNKVQPVENTNNGPVWA